MPLFGAPNLTKLTARRDVEGLVKALGNPSVCEGAASALGQLGDARAVEPLTAALGDESWSMRRAAAEALGRLRDAALYARSSALS